MAEQATQVFVQGNAVSVAVEPNETHVSVGHGFPIQLGEASGAGSFSKTFTDADLSIADLLPVTHNLNRYPAGVFVQDADGEQIGPDAIDVTSLNALALNLTSFRPLTGTWRVQIT